MRSFSRELPLKTGAGTSSLVFSPLTWSTVETCGCCYLEGSWLEAGLADGESTRLGEEYGEVEGPREDKKFLLFCGGDLKAVT